ncbi:MAG: hypothetical protein NVSMB62_02530 [Acidobacteriaceae bacterium]
MDDASPLSTEKKSASHRNLLRPASKLGTRRHRLLHPTLLITLTAIAATILIIRLPLTVPMPDYWTDAQQLVQIGHITRHFIPSGYPTELAVGMKLAPLRPERGVEVVQAVLQVATVLTAWWLILELGASAAAAFAGGLVFTLHPELLITVVKVWDVNLSTLLLLFLVIPSLLILRRGPLLRYAALLGSIWAFGIFNRPNYALLLPALLFVLWRATPSAERAKRLPLTIAALLAVSCAVYGTISLSVYRAVVFPGNGPYNLYAGQNTFTERALLDQLNAETAIVPALQAAHMPEAAANPHDLALQPYFTHAAIVFAATHPATELRLIAVKLFTLLRPDTKLHPINTPQGWIEALMVLPVPIWLAALLYCRLRRVSWTPADTLLVFLALLYAFPFLVTNSDPRFRMGLDALAIVHATALFSRATLRTGRAVPL